MHSTQKLLAFSLIVVGIFTFSAFKLDPKNPPTGQTGAPNETTCSSASGCHSGGSYTGTVALTGVPDQILPNTAYNVTVTLTSTCSRTGFELTVLDKNNTKCGTLTAGNNNNVKLAGTREYVRQTNASSLTSGKASYAFKWTSPASITGDSAVFYYVMLQANGNGGTSGDNVAKGKKTVAMGVPSSTQENKEFDVKVYPNPAQEFINIKQSNEVSYQVQLVNTSGKELMSFTMEQSKVLDVRNLPSGQYFLHFNKGNQKYTKSISLVK